MNWSKFSTTCSIKFYIVWVCYSICIILAGGWLTPYMQQLYINTLKCFLLLMELNVIQISVLLVSNISQNFSPLVLFQVYRRVVWSESLVSGASRGLGAAGVQFRSTVPEPHPNTVCSSRASVLLRDCKTLLCTGFFHIASWNIDVLWICFSRRRGMFKEPLVESFCLQKNICETSLCHLLA